MARSGRPIQANSSQFLPVLANSLRSVRQFQPVPASSDQFQPALGGGIAAQGPDLIAIMLKHAKTGLEKFLLPLVFPLKT
jgi:hypothetical protein